MTRYATTEKQYECWGCGYKIPIRSMWTTKTHPFTFRCPGCKENILFIDAHKFRRAGAYYGTIPYRDNTDPLFEGGMLMVNAGVVND